MKIITVTTTQEEYGFIEETDFETKLETDAYTGSVSIGRGEPEDMTLTRDLSGVFNIPDMLKAAYEAGLRGEILEFEYLTE